jgi:FixJ family two-component response regulator
MLSTGYGHESVARDTLDEGVLGLLQKPYRLQQLSESVALALRRARRRTAAKAEIKG